MAENTQLAAVRAILPHWRRTAARRVGATFRSAGASGELEDIRIEPKEARHGLAPDAVAAVLRNALDERIPHWSRTEGVDGWIAVQIREGVVTLWIDRASRGTQLAQYELGSDPAQAVPIAGPRSFN